MRNALDDEFNVGGSPLEIGVAGTDVVGARGIRAVSGVGALISDFFGVSVKVLFRDELLRVEEL